MTESDQQGHKPAIVTVDDDPSVSRAVARDLRRQYGADHRIVRGESGQETLESLRELKLRGDEVAVILADYRMPGMNGIEFLEQAMDVFPFARRVLLTAYADTDAAIAAINVVDVDHYLLKPWDPPEEKLYPVVDELLEVWRASNRVAVPEVKVVGHRWSARSFEVRDFLARNRVPYRWYTIDDHADDDGDGGGDRGEAARLLAAADAGTDCIPLVVTAQGDVLRDPSDTELAARVGLTVDPTEEFYDVVVVGGGPAGLGAAVYAASEGLRTVLVERTATGGQAGQSSRIENYLGFPDGISGSQLAERARRQAVKFGAEVVSARDVTAVEANGSARVVRFADGGTLSAHTAILATGVSYRLLDATGAHALTGRGVYYGAALTEAASCSAQDVYVIGGANSAGQAALHFARLCSSVTMLVRGPSLEASMSSYLVDQIQATPNIRVRTRCSVVEAHGTDHLEGLTIADAATGEKESVATQWLFIFIGAAPRTEWLDESVVRDARGFLLTGPDLLSDGRRPADWAPDRDPYPLETSIPGVFVAGDVRADSVKRVASAVGEGAMAVMLVHPTCRPRETSRPREEMMASPEVPSCSPELLRSLFLFESLSEDRLSYLCEHGDVIAVDPGWLYRQGDNATCFYVLLDGSLVMSRNVDGDEVEVNRTTFRGSYVGAWNAYLGDLVPQVYDQSVRAVVPTTFFQLDASVLRDVMNQWFPMAQHLLSGLFQGFTNRQRTIAQRERLLALGSLSAGLTHELNNPAAAAVRATSTLQQRVSKMREKLSALAGGHLDEAALQTLIKFQDEAAQRVATAPKLSAMQATDREDELGDWLEDHGVQRAYDIAATFVQAGLDVDWLELVANAAPPDSLASAVQWLYYAVDTELLMKEITDSTRRISSLVDAAKQYSQMDRSPFQTVDLHDLLDSTLVMLGRKIPTGVRVVKAYDESLPAVPSYAAELNQVWTNLIDNALQAMGEHGTLRISTHHDDEYATVKINDTGPGIPEDVKDRIFEPFFTSKPIGFGTGLGLDIAWRIVVNKHRGYLKVMSEPGSTTFVVRLPLAGPQIGETA